MCYASSYGYKVPHYNVTPGFTSIGVDSAPFIDEHDIPFTMEDCPADFFESPPPEAEQRKKSEDLEKREFTRLMRCPEKPLIVKNFTKLSEGIKPESVQKKSQIHGLAKFRS
eukprot:1733311-Amphidinium_carterae.1